MTSEPLASPFGERMTGGYTAPILHEPVGGPIPTFDPDWEDNFPEPEGDD